MCVRQCSALMCAAMNVLACLPAVSAENLPRSSTYKIRRTPDLRQKIVQKKVGFTGYCATTSVSNTLMYLGRNGYPRLIPEAANDREAQIKLTATLGSMKYLKTERGRGGTVKDDLIRGVFRYILDCGYTGKHRGRIPRKQSQSATNNCLAPQNWCIK